MIGTEASKETVLPLLLDGTEETAFPHVLRGRVYADFRTGRDYFLAAFDLILDLYAIPKQHQAVADLRQMLQGKAGLGSGL
jgi:hypothetical protein